MPEISDLVPELRGILDAELEQGNEVAEVGEWGPTCRLLVLLRRPFARSYLLPPGVEFASVNDPHYWKDEYRYRGGIQTLGCKFG